MRQSHHPLVERDLRELVDHILDVTGGDTNAALRRLDEIDALLEDVAGTPASGVRLSDDLAGWLVRHGGRGQRLTIVFRSDPAARILYISVIAFGGRDWLSEADNRKGFGSEPHPET